MAKAEVIEVMPVLPVKKIILTLDWSEADALLSLAGFVGGDPDNSPRAFIDSVFDALVAAMEMPYPRTEAYGLISDPKHKNRIVFDDYKHNE